MVSTSLRTLCLGKVFAASANLFLLTVQGVLCVFCYEVSSKM